MFTMGVDCIIVHQREKRDGENHSPRRLGNPYGAPTSKIIFWDVIFSHCVSMQEGVICWRIAMEAVVQDEGVICHYF